MGALGAAKAVSKIAKKSKGVSSLPKDLKKISKAQTDVAKKIASNQKKATKSLLEPQVSKINDM